MQIEYNRKMIAHIEYEELSYEYHNAREQYRCACDEYGEAAAAKEKARNNVNDAKRYYNLLKAAELYDELKKEKARENLAREELRQMEKGSDPDRYNDLIFSLLQCYSEQMCELHNESVYIQQTHDEYVQGKIDLQTENVEINKTNNELSLKIGELKTNIKNFDEYENKLLKELDVSPVHMLNDELDKGSVKDIRESFSDK